MRSSAGWESGWGGEEVALVMRVLYPIRWVVSSHGHRRADPDRRRHHDGRVPDRRGRPVSRGATARRPAPQRDHGARELLDPGGPHLHGRRALAHGPAPRAGVSAPPVAPTLSLLPSDEETMLREAVAGICAGFGPEYMRRQIGAGEPPTELWDALAERGYLGVNIPEEYDGGGRGLTELAAVGEEVARAGCAVLLIVVSPAIAGSVLARHGT